MQTRFSAHGERWPLARPFRIARGERNVTECVVVEIEQDGIVGRGEGMPYDRYGETVDDVLGMLRSVARDIEDDPNRHSLSRLLSPGAARNAVDAALWDLEARLAGTTVAGLIGMPDPGPMPTAITISLGAPKQMAQAAESLEDVPLIKVKMDNDAPEAALRAVREAAPQPRLIVDPNESWDPETLSRMMPVMAELRVDMVEQPLPANKDEALKSIEALVPVCADESAHTSADVAELADRYDAINIKLDKSGGLTEALNMLAASRARNFKVMVGCMMSTSLSMAPALQVAQAADYVDLDGPWWLAFDRHDGLEFDKGILHPPAMGWGRPGPA